MYFDAGLLVDGREKSENDINKKYPAMVFRRSQSLHKVKRFTETPQSAKKVYVHLSFLKFGEVNTLTEKFDADVLVRCRWREPSLDYVMYKSDPQNNNADWSDYWNPKLFLENAIGEPVTTSSISPEVDSEGQAWLVERKRFKGTFMETLELWDFPFDVQDLSVSLMSEYPNDLVQLVQDPKEVHKLNRENFIDEQEWYLYNYLESEKSDRAKDPIDPSIKSSTVIVRARAARRPAYFLFNNFLITFLIVCLSFTTFSVDHNLPQNRLQLSFTLILTTVAFKFVVNQSLPKLSYLTYLDRYMLTCMIVLMILSIWHSISAAFNIQFSVEWMVAVGFAGLYLGYNVCFWTSIYFGPYIKRREMKHKEADYKVKVSLSGSKTEAKKFMNELRKTLVEFDLEPPTAVKR